MLCFSFAVVHAQQDHELPNYATFVKGFVQGFNNKNFSLIAGTASAAFLKSVPEKKLVTFLGGIREAFGEIKKVKYKYIDSKGSAVYHAELDSTWFNFVFGLNDSNLLQRLVVLDPNYNEDLPAKKNKTSMRLPFDSTWYVFWGGDNEDENYHVTNRAQKNAFDLLIKDAAGKSFRTDGKTNEDYYAFGENIYSPCKGVVVKVIDGVAQNVPGKMNPAELTGNSVIINSDKNEYILMAHFQTNSVIVKVGDRVVAGQKIAVCGNSGNSSEPHLHMHIMDAPSLRTATGIKCYFEKIHVDGVEKKAYSPVRGERISN
jgi:hypothetical protein